MHEKLHTEKSHWNKNKELYKIQKYIIITIKIWLFIQVCVSVNISIANDKNLLLIDIIIWGEWVWGHE